LRPGCRRHALHQLRMFFHKNHTFFFPRG
jgi:hypothetical protein